MTWDGNQKIGAGRMTIVGSRPSDLIQLKLDFERPFKNTNMTEFRLLPDGPQTEVKWTMTSRSNTFFKVFSLLVNCEKMASRDFEKGLDSLKNIAER